MNLTVDLLFLIAANILLFGSATSGKPKANLAADETAPDPGLGAAHLLTAILDHCLLTAKIHETSKTPRRARDFASLAAADQVMPRQLPSLP